MSISPKAKWIAGERQKFRRNEGRNGEGVFSRWPFRWGRKSSCASGSLTTGRVCPRFPWACGLRPQGACANARRRAGETGAGGRSGAGPVEVRGHGDLVPACGSEAEESGFTAGRSLGGERESSEKMEEERGSFSPKSHADRDCSAAPGRRGRETFLKIIHTFQKKTGKHLG